MRADRLVLDAPVQAVRGPVPGEDGLDGGPGDPYRGGGRAGVAGTWEPDCSVPFRDCDLPELSTAAANDDQNTAGHGGSLDGYPSRLVAHAAPDTDAVAATPDATSTSPPVVPDAGGAATATPDPGGTDAGGVVSGAFEAIICSEPWPCGEAISVARCESGTDVRGRLDGNFASNGDNYGLFQLNSIHAGLWPDFWAAWSDPVRNTAWAFEIWSEAGGTFWPDWRGSSACWQGWTP